MFFLFFFMPVWAMQDQQLARPKSEQNLMVLVKKNQKLRERVAHLKEKNKKMKTALQKDEDDRFYFSDAQRYGLMKKYVKENYVCLGCLEDKEWEQEYELLLDEYEVKELTIEFLKISITEQNINFLLLKKELRSAKKEIEKIKQEHREEINRMFEVTLFCFLIAGMYYYQFGC